MEEKQPVSTPEIDLTYFFRPLGNIFKQIAKAIRSYYFRLTNNGILFFAVIFLITAAAYCMRYTIQPSYRTEGVFISRMLPGKYCTQLISNLNKLKGKTNIALLAKHLQINETSALTIRNIELSAIEDTLTINAKDTFMTVFTINLILSEMTYLDSIQGGIVNYLENTPYVVRRKEARVQSLYALKASLNAKLQSLDSLRKTVAQSIIPRSQGQGIILGEPINPVTIYQAEVAYLKEQLVIDEELKLIDNIEVVQPFLKFNRTNYPNYTMMVIYGFLVSLFATLIITPVFGRKPKSV